MTLEVQPGPSPSPFDPDPSNAVEMTSAGSTPVDPETGTTGVVAAPTGPRRTLRNAGRIGSTGLLLLVIMALAFVLRAWNLDWDRGTHLQPDERFWSDVANHSTLPDGWSWGAVFDPGAWTWGDEEAPPIQFLDLGPRFASADASGVITDVVWADENRNGVFDPAEGPINGATISLIGGDGQLQATTVTDAAGRYRFDGLDDGGYTVRVDQPWRVSDFFNPERSRLNPRNYKPNYVYGTLPLWSSEAAAGLLMTPAGTPLVWTLDAVGVDLLNDGPEGAPVGERLRFNTGFDVTIVGRLMSAFVDTLTVAAVFFLGRELGGRRAGLLAAVLQTFAVLHIQYSHFLGSEPWVALFVTVVVWGAVRLARGRGGWPTRLLTGIALGFAIGSKLNGVGAAVAPVIAVLVLLGPDLAAAFKGPRTNGYWHRVWRVVEPWLVMALVAVVAYRIAQPYDFEGGFSLAFNQQFEDDIAYLTDINQGGNWPWVQPLVGAVPLLHPLNQIFWWGMGPGLALAALGGAVWAARRFLVGERFWAIPLAVIASYLVLVSLQFYAIIRYLQPAYPTMIALAAVGLLAAWRWAGSLDADRQRLARIVRILVIGSVAATAFWALAFVNGVYNNDNARLTASEWMVENLPAGASVSAQSWDDPLPWGIPSDFNIVTLEPFSFGGDAPDRIELLISGLDQVDYVVESSNKFYDSLPRTPARFPQMTEYYDRLFDGSLGFELIAEFNNPPSFLGITIDDRGAEEAFTLYDHPTVFIWQKTERFSVERAYALLNPDRARTAINAIPGDAYANAAMLTPQTYAVQQQGSSFSSVHSSDAGSVSSTLQWFVVIQLAAFAVAPFVLVGAGRGAGAAWGLTKVLGLTVLALPVWLVVSWGIVPMSRPLLVAATLTLLAIGGTYAWANLTRLRALWRTHRRTILVAEALFVGVFLAIVAMRAANPDIWHPWRGGEKPMEFAYFNAVTGSTTLPPFDPWLAGGSINYYYFGFFLLAVPTRLLGLQPDIAFNLGVATFAALAAVTVFSTVSLMVGLAQRRLDASKGPLGTASTVSPAKAGLLGTVLFLVIGNLDALRQVITRIRTDMPIRDFDWWDPSRVNKNAPGLEVTEFPAFTVLFADLHPHFMAMPLFGLGLAGAVALIERARQGRTVSTWVLTIGLGIGTAIIRMTHTWDLPTFGVFSAGAIVLGHLIGRGPGLWRARTAVLQLATLGGVHLAVSAPYRGANQVADSGFSRSQSTTNLDDWFAHWGIFVFVAASYLALRAWELRSEINPKSWQLAVAAVPPLLGFVRWHTRVGSVAAWTWLFLIAAVVVLTLEVRRRTASSGHVMAAACFALGFGVLLGVEMFTQNADIQRLNTVFKFWLQVWHLFAVASAFGAIWVLRRARVGVAELAEGVATKARPARRSWQSAFGTGLAVLLAVSLLFPLLSVQPRAANRIDTTLGPSLQGDLWLEPGLTQFGIRDAFENEYLIDPGLDAPLIEWLRTNVTGRPTIVEGVGGAEYQWWGRMSIHTGLPTVLGWRWHQDQQRTLFNFEVNERKSDVARFYTTNDSREIESFLRAYDVSYVVVGSLEAVSASPQTLQLFAQHPSLVEVFRNGETAIYEVAKRSLARSAAPTSEVASG